MKAFEQKPIVLPSLYGDILLQSFEPRSFYATRLFTIK